MVELWIQKVMMVKNQEEEGKKEGESSGIFRNQRKLAHICRWELGQLFE